MSIRIMYWLGAAFSISGVMLSQEIRFLWAI